MNEESYNELIHKCLFDLKEVLSRLQVELKISKIEDSDKKDSALNQLKYTFKDVIIIILDYIHQNKVPDGLYTTFIKMVKDYWYLNKYDEMFVLTDEEVEEKNNKFKIKSLQEGDTTTTFTDTSSQIEINGVTYNTGSVNFSEDILVNKYKSDLNRHRRLRR